MKRNRIITNLILLLQGAIVGTGAILPGVSGGVLCVAFGVYKPMMELLSHPMKAFKSYYKMFIPFLVGWLLGFTLLANAVELMFRAADTVALMLFIGLIMGTVPGLLKDSEKSDEKASWTPFVLSFSLAFFLFSMLEQEITGAVAPSFWGFVFCGMVWGLSLIVPGLSSSSLLLYMGLYEPMTAGIAALDFSVILPLLGGLAVVVILFARLVHFLYAKHYALISRLILGFILASTVLIIPTQFQSFWMFAISIVCFAIGYALARWMDIARDKQNPSL